MGFAVNASTMGMAVSRLVVALFSRRIDRRLGIVVSLALLAIPTALLAVAQGGGGRHRDPRRARHRGGTGMSTTLFLRRRMAKQHYETYKIRIGRSLLLWLPSRRGGRHCQDDCRRAHPRESGHACRARAHPHLPELTVVLEIEGRWLWQATATRAEASEPNITSVVSAPARRAD